MKYVYYFIAFLVANVLLAFLGIYLPHWFSNFIVLWFICYGFVKLLMIFRDHLNWSAKSDEQIVKISLLPSVIINVLYVISMDLLLIVFFTVLLIVIINAANKLK